MAVEDQRPVPVGRDLDAVGGLAEDAGQQRRRGGAGATKSIRAIAVTPDVAGRRCRLGGAGATGGERDERERGGEQRDQGATPET